MTWRRTKGKLNAGAHVLLQRQTDEHGSIEDEDWSELVTVVAGEKKISFKLHRKVLCENSDFFRKALSGPWKENEEKSVTLPEIDALSFKVYASWIYSHKVDHESLAFGKQAGKILAGDEMMPYERNCLRLERRAEEHDKAYKERLDRYMEDNPTAPSSYVGHRIVRLWITGDFLGGRKFQNAVADLLVTGLSTWSPQPQLNLFIETIRLVGYSTVRESPLRKLIVDVLARSEDDCDLLAKNYEDYPNWLLAVVLGKMSEPRLKDPPEMEKSDYYLPRVEGR